MSLVEDGGSLTHVHVLVDKTNIIRLCGVTLYSGRSDYLCSQLEMKGLQLNTGKP
jgi:hypothetical protein